MAEKEEKIEKSNVAGGAILIIIIIIGAFYLFFSFINSDEYSSCINDCIYDNSDCLSSSYIYDNQGNAYVSDLDAEICSGELEICVNRCK
jgi:hypothetical protein